MENEKSPFKNVSEQLPFYPDIKSETAQHDEFIGVYTGETILGDDPDPTKQIPVYIFAKVDGGEKHFVIRSYAIKKAVETAKKEYGTLTDVVFRFKFIGKTMVNGKPFNQFDTAYCLQEEYDLFLSDEVTKPSKKK